MAESAYTVASDGETYAEEKTSPGFSQIAIGIDIGTSHCHVAIWNGSEVEVLKNTNQITVQSSAFNIKRLIGRVDTDPVVHASKGLPFIVQSLGIGARPYIAALVDNIWQSTTPEEVLAIFLIELRNIAEVQLKRPVRDAVLTVPVSFSRFQLTRIARACAVAGLYVRRLIPEPTAVALLYAQQQLQGMNESTGSGSEKIALIFNIGAGYVDVAITATSSGMSHIKALLGSAIGGEDLLQNTMRDLLPEYDTLFSSCGIKGMKEMALLRVATESAIHKLSSEPRTEVNVDLGNGIKVSKIVERREFEDVNRKVFERCETLIRQCLHDAKIEAKDLTDVIVVGGCSYIPKIRNLVRSVCKRDEFYGGIDPLEGAVCGVALQGAVDSGTSDSFGNLRPLLTIQVTPLSIGIRANENGFVTIIPRYTTFPAKKELLFTTVHDNQAEALIVVYEGQETKIEENHLLGYFKITGIPSGPKGVPEIKVCMDIDANNVLKVRAGSTLPGSEQLEVRMPTVDDGHGWCTEALNKTYGSTLDLATL